MLVKNQRFLSMLGNCNNLLYIFCNFRHKANQRFANARKFNRISDILRTDNYCIIIFVREYSLYIMSITGVYNWAHGLVARIQPSQGWGAGSIPAGPTLSFRGIVNSTLHAFHQRFRKGLVQFSLGPLKLILAQSIANSC